MLSAFSLIFGTVKTSDIDAKTILSLSSLLIIVALYHELGILKLLADYIVSKCHGTRLVFLVLLLCSYFGSMLFTNDVAILTLIPIFFSIRKYMALPPILTISMLVIYANLGSSITPFGNPQNIYMMSFYKLNILSFLSMSMPLGLISLVTLCLIPLCIKNKNVKVAFQNTHRINWQQASLLFLASMIVLLGILSLIPVAISLFVSIASALILSRNVFEKIDYGIILTIINFFIIVGAISRLTFVHDLLSIYTQNNRSTFITSTIISQVISNVPAAVLLSKFTHNVYAVFLGVTIGGLGTLVASLANLLALRQYTINSHNHTSFQFFKQFTLLNIIFLIIFVFIGLLLLKA
ncbi:SLC13 family permease [Leuconostoc rapi]